MDVAQHHEHAVVGRENAHEEVSHGDGIRWIRSVVAAAAETVESRTGPAKSSQREERTISSDSEEPRSRILHRSQLSAPLDRDEQGLLQDVLGEKAIAHDLDKKPAERLLGSLKERLQTARFRWHGPLLESSADLHVNTFPRDALL
jgi:hypothetical protein